MEVRNRFVSSNASPAPVRKLFAGENKHPYDELAYDYNEGATQAEHRVALTFALSAWIRNGAGAAERLAELTAVLEHELGYAISENEAAQTALDVCRRVLEEDFVPVATANVIAAGFVTEERFVDPDVPDDEGVTVRELWDWSPFAPLREAEPLAEEDDETEVPSSVLDHNVSVNAPLWVWLTATGFVVTYCWLVALLIGLSIKTA